MIKLNLPQEPPELTAQKARLTAEYREKKKAVWSEGAVGETIKRVLCEMTHNKCAYSEAPLETNGSVKHIEHFYPKSIYPERVVEWGNLLPTCATCNAGKGKLDVEKTPIVNPLRDDPKDFLYVEGFRYRACDQKGVGQRTIDVLRLNNLAQFGVPRFKAAQYNSGGDRACVAPSRCHCRLPAARRSAATDGGSRTLSPLFRGDRHPFAL